MQELLDDVKLAAQQAQTGTTRIAWADADRLLSCQKNSGELPEDMRALLPKLRIAEVLAVSMRLARAEMLGELRQSLNEFELTTVEMAVRFLRCANLLKDL